MSDIFVTVLLIAALVLLGLTAHQHSKRPETPSHQNHSVFSEQEDVKEHLVWQWRVGFMVALVLGLVAFGMGMA